MKKFITLSILIIILNCSLRQTLLINYEDKPFSQFDWETETNIPSPYIPEKEEDDWNTFKRRMNFFRFPWMDDYYEDYEFEYYGIKFYKIYACIKLAEWKKKPDYLQDIFKPYNEKISNLNHITIIHREVLIHSTITSATSSHCLILTGMINEIRN